MSKNMATTCVFKLMVWICLHLRSTPICLVVTDLSRCGARQKCSGKRKSCRIPPLPWTYTALECWCGKSSTTKHHSTVIRLPASTSCVIRMCDRGLMSIKMTKRTLMRTQKKKKMTKTSKSARSRSQIWSGSVGRANRVRDPPSTGSSNSSTRRSRSTARLLKLKLWAKDRVMKI